MIKKHAEEIVISILQLLLFYVGGIYLEPLMLTAGSAILSALMGLLSRSRLKWAYPVFSTVFFVPVIFIYYNESALIYLLYIFVPGFAFVAYGVLLRALAKLIWNKIFRGRKRF